MDVEKIYKNSFLVVFVAIFLSLILQSIFLLHVKDNPSYFFDGNFIPLWTHDAGLYGFYAKKLISGANIAFKSEYMPGWLLYALYKLTPFSLEQLMFFTPVFISSLVIVPIFGMLKLFNLEKVGFFAGILTTLSFGYYYRSFFGYYDTDILNLFFPLMIIWGLIGFCHTNKKIFILLSALSMLGFSLWYHSYIAIGASIVLMWTLYTLIFKRDDFNSYLVLLMLAIPFLHVNITIKLISIFVMFLLTYQRFFIRSKYLPFIFLALVIVGGFFIDANSFIQRASEYIYKAEFTKLANIAFLNTLGTVSEASSIGFERFFNLSSSNISFGLIGIFGYILLVLKHRQYLLLLPLGFIGFLALVAGERFVIYGVSLFSIGIAYLTHEICSGLPKYKNIAILGLMCVVSIFYIKDIITFSKYEKPIFNKSELHVISKLPKAKDNFILTWWDYGWPLWYETEAQTLIDNGKHFEDNYIISKLLFLNNQNIVANASKQTVKLFKKARKKGHYKLMTYLLKGRSLNEALTLLNTPSVTKTPIYWYLNTQLLDIANSIEEFSNIDHKNRKRKNGSFIAYIKNSYGAKFNAHKGVLTINGKPIQMASYNNLMTKDSRKYNQNGFYLVLTKTHFLVCTKNIYNSFLVQSLLFKNVNKKLFEIISQDDTSMLIKVK